MLQVNFLVYSKNCGLALADAAMHRTRAADARCQPRWEFDEE
jgi:hypothetical protein